MNNEITTDPKFYSATLENIRNNAFTRKDIVGATGVESLAEIEKDDALRMLQDELVSKLDLKSAAKRETKQNLDVLKREVADLVVRFTTKYSIKGIKTEEELSHFSELVFSVSQGLDILEDLYRDPTVTDIFCLGKDLIFVRRDGIMEKVKDLHFDDQLHYDRFISRIVSFGAKELDSGNNAIVDFSLYGDRYNVINEPVGNQKYVTLRKHQKDQITYNQIIQSKVLNIKADRLFEGLIAGGRSFVLAGVTGSGKTTTLRAVMDYYLPKYEPRVLVVEDTRELHLEYDHTVSLLSNEASKGDTNTKAGFNLSDLIETSLRLNPELILIGEIRGKEAKDALEAQNTGHPADFTMHSSTIPEGINRLVSNYLKANPSLDRQLIESIIGNSIDLFIVQSKVPDVGRRLMYLTEISYSNELKELITRPIMRFNPNTEILEMVDLLSPIKLELAYQRGGRRAAKVLKPFVKEESDDLKYGYLSEQEKLDEKERIRKLNKKKLATLKGLKGLELMQYLGYDNHENGLDVTMADDYA